MSEVDFNRMAWTMGIVFTLSGGMALAAARYDLLKKGQQIAFLRWLLWPYRMLDAQWVTGGTRRFLYEVGGLLVLLGLATILGQLGVW
jgi:hypothetical protein